MCHPRRNGGCGIKKLEPQNNAFPMKIGFTLATKPDLLWVRVLRCKYGWEDLNGPSRNNQNGSLLWCNIKRIWPDLELGMRWEIGDGSKVRFWADNWLANVGPLKLLASRDIMEEELVLPVCNFIGLDSNWEWSLFNRDLPDQILSIIAGTRPPSQEDGDASCFWDRTSDGYFSVKSAYDLIMGDVWDSQDNKWDVIWKHEGAQRVRVFLWLALRGALLTNKEHVRRHMTDNEACSLCGNEREDVDHILKQCKLARDVWKIFVPSRQMAQFMNNNFVDWMIQYLRGSMTTPFPSGEWASMFGLTY